MDGIQKKINIVITGLFIGEGSFGGINNFVVFLLKNIDKNQFNTKYYSTGKSPKYYNGVPPTTFNKYFIETLIRILYFPLYLIINKIHVIHVNTSLIQLPIFRDGAIALIGKLLNCKTVFVIHGWKENELINIRKSMLKRVLFRQLLRCQNKIGVSSLEYKLVLNQFGVDSNKIFVFSTMVDCDIFKCEFNSKNQHITLLFSAHPILKEKGIVEFLNAISLIKVKFPFCIINIMGGGKYLEKFIEISKRIGVYNHVNFVGYVQFAEKVEIFKKSHILVFPSYTEGFPSTVLEAMASRMAIITTHVGGLVNAIKEYDNGLIIKSMPPDYREIASKVNDLLKDNLLMKKMMDRNYIEVREKYGVNIITKQFMEIYKEVK